MRVSLGELIGLGFYALLAMVYKFFNIYLLLYRVYPLDYIYEVIYTHVVTTIILAEKNMTCHLK